MRAAILGIVLLVGGLARADASGARSHFLSGLQLYIQGQYAAALAEYQAAWVTWEDPELLLDMAECNRHLGRLDEAREQYRGFLQRAPQSPLRASVERQLARLDAPAAPPPAELVAVAAPPSSPPPSPSRGDRAHPGRAAIAIGVAGWAASIVADAVGVYTWSQQSALQNTAHVDLVQLHSANGVITSPEERAWFANPTCSPPSSLINTAQYVGDCHRGQQFSTATTALLITSLVAAAGGTASFVVGMSQAARARPVEVRPAISLSEASLTLRFPF